MKKVTSSKGDNPALADAARRLFRDKKSADREMFAKEEQLFAEFEANRIDAVEWYRRFAVLEREWWGKQIDVLGEWQRTRMRIEREE
jgi:hypothetical protein